jgi:hypothetical protein
MINFVNSKWTQLLIAEAPNKEQITAHHSFRRQEWFDDVLQVQCILPSRIEYHQYTDKNKTPHSGLGVEVCKERLYNSLTHLPTLL